MNHALKALQLKAKEQVHTLLSGHSLSRLQGEGYDFSELREYQIGDDIRKINWMISAKLGKPYIKTLHSNRELSVAVATFMDASFYFAYNHAKQKKLTEVATLLGYATLQQNDLFRGFCFTQAQTYHTPPTKQHYHLETFSQTLYEIPLLHTTLERKTALATLFQALTTPSLLFIVSDFLEAVDLSLLAQKHEVIAIIIRDEAEESPQILGEVTLQSPHNADKKRTYFGKKTQEKYLHQLQQHDAKQKEHFAQHHIRHVKILTKDDVVKKLMTLFT